ncbi:MAG: radical SAM protein [Dehalococcoidia bacterium]|nr:radical SAM protein [Dehalococcoidia bacterium]
MRLTELARNALKARIDLPLSLILLVTSRCNSQCVHCFFKSRLNQHQNEMTLAEYEELSRSLGRLMALRVSGGEPALREDLAEICRIFWRNNNVDELSLATNGQMPERVSEAVRQILGACRSDLIVSLSLDGTALVHDTVRGVKGSFDHAVRTYRYLAELKKSSARLRLYVVSVVSVDNYDNLPELARFVASEMPEVSGHNFELVREKRNWVSSKLPTLDKCEQLSALQSAVSASHRDYYHGSALKSLLMQGFQQYCFSMYCRTLKEGKQIVPCRAGQAMGVVNEEGEVFLCELFDKVGNVRDGGFLAAWNSPEAERQRREIASGRCYCTHSCFRGLSVALYPWAYPRVLARAIFGRRGRLD